MTVKKIARAGRILGIHSEARHRFERGIDIEMVRTAMSYTLGFFEKVEGMKEYRNDKAFAELEAFKARMIKLDRRELVKIVGNDINKEIMLSTLDRLGIKLSTAHDEVYTFTVPSFRDDLSISEDLVEEVVRIYGIDKIISKAFSMSPVHKKNGVLEEKMRKILCARGLNEVISWSLCSSDAKVFCEEMLEVVNPINKNMSFLRRSLLHGMLETAVFAMTRGIREISLYEIGNVYYPDAERKNIGIVRSGYASNRNVHDNTRGYDFYDIKKDVLYFLENMGVNGNFIESDSVKEKYLHPYRAINLFLGQKHIASFGVLSPEVSRSYGIKTQEVLIAEIWLDRVPLSVNKKAGKYTSVDYPIVYRDFAFLIEKDIQVASLTQAILKSNRKYIGNVKVFDVYTGKGIPIQKKSVGIEVKILPQKSSLTEREIKEISNSIIKSAEESCGAILRD